MKKQVNVKAQTQEKEASLASVIVALLVLFLIGSCTVNMFTMTDEDVYGSARYFSQR